MDAQTILRIRPALIEYQHIVDGWMGRRTNRQHLNTYVTGQLGDLDRKSVELIAKQGTKTAHLQRQHCGCRDKICGCARSTAGSRPHDVNGCGGNTGIAQSKMHAAFL